jgi:hypothetical protein
MKGIRTLNFPKADGKNAAKSFHQQGICSTRRFINQQDNS